MITKVENNKFQNVNLSLNKVLIDFFCFNANYYVYGEDVFSKEVIIFLFTYENLKGLVESLKELEDSNEYKEFITYLEKELEQNKELYIFIA